MFALKQIKNKSATTKGSTEQNHAKAKKSMLWNYMCRNLVVETSYIKLLFFGNCKL